MEVYVKKATEKSRRFKPHFNTATDTYYQTKEDYLGDLKKRGLEPYTGEAKEPKRKEHAPSQWAKDMARHIIHVTDNKGQAHVSNSFRAELEKRGIKLQSSNDKVNTRYDSGKGGFV